MARNWRWHLGNFPQDTEAFSPTVCKELNVANNHVSLEIDPSPVKLQIRPQPWQYLDCSLIEDPVKPSPELLIHRNFEVINVCVVLL